MTDLRCGGVTSTMALVNKAAGTWVPPPIQRNKGDISTQPAEKVP